MATVWTAYHHALDIEPEHVKAHLGIGDAYRAKGELDASAFRYQAVVDLDPEVLGPHAKPGMCKLL
jgi:predicted TPR repeat methyltransferase